MVGTSNLGFWNSHWHTQSTYFFGGYSLTYTLHTPCIDLAYGRHPSINRFLWISGYLWSLLIWPVPSVPSPKNHRLRRVSPADPLWGNAFHLGDARGAIGERSRGTFQLFVISPMGQFWLLMIRWGIILPSFLEIIIYYLKNIKNVVRKVV
jgi:hypothetical protein